MQWNVINLDNEAAGTVDLAETIFSVPVRADILSRAVNWQLAKRRAGTHKVKTRSEIARTGKKPFRQKGTGRARQGSNKGPHMRGGAVVHGPVVRGHGTDLPKKVRRLALRCALSAKVASGDLVIVEEAALAEPKSRLLINRSASLGWKSALIIDGETVDANLARAARNVVGVDVLPTMGANVYDILRHDTLVLTRAAVDRLVERLS